MGGRQLHSITIKMNKMNNLSDERNLIHPVGRWLRISISLRAIRLPHVQLDSFSV